MEDTRDINLHDIASKIDNVIEDNPPGDAENLTASHGINPEDYPGFCKACQIYQAIIFKSGATEDDNTSSKESPARKGNSLEVPERRNLGKELITTGDTVYGVQKTAEAVKESSNTENREQISFCNKRQMDESQIFTSSLTKSDQTDESQIEIQQSQGRSSEMETGIEDGCLQIKHECNQVGTGETLLDLSRETPICITIPIKTDREKDDNEKDVNYSLRNKTDFDIMLSDTEGNILDEEQPAEMSYSQNYHNRTLKVDCPTCKHQESSSQIGLETSYSNMFTVVNNTSTASIKRDDTFEASIEKDSTFVAFTEKETDYFKSMPKINNCATLEKTEYMCTLLPQKVNISTASQETDKISITNVNMCSLPVDTYKISTTNVKMCPLPVDTDKISTTNVNMCPLPVDTDKISTTSVNICPTLVEADTTSTQAQKVNISSVAIETDKLSVTPTSKVNISSVPIETDKLSVSPTSKVNISSVAIETDKLSVTPTPKVNISSVAVETGNSSIISQSKVDISAHFAGDCHDILRVQKNEIPDCTEIKISEISPDNDKPNVTSMLENGTQITDNCCPNPISNNLSKEANIFVNCDTETPGDYTVEDALFLAKSYISELERVANNIERILQSDRSELEVDKKDRCTFEVSDSCLEFEVNKDIMGDNHEIAEKDIIMELSTSVVEENPTIAFKVVGVNDDSVTIWKDLNNEKEEHVSEYMSSVHRAVQAQCSFGENGAICGQTNFSRVSSNSDNKSFGRELPPHNRNNNNHCYVIASNDNNIKRTSVNILAINHWLNTIRKMRSIFCDGTESRYVKDHCYFVYQSAVRRVANDEIIYENTNNNGNNLSHTPRNITLSPEPASGRAAHSDTKQNCQKTRKQRLKNKLTTGYDLLVFEGSKVYSVAQKTSDCKELVGKFVSKVGNEKQFHSEKSQFGHEFSVDSPLRGCQSVNQFSEIKDGLAAQCEKTGQPPQTQDEGQAGNFDENSEKVKDGLKLPSREKIQSQSSTTLASHTDDANKTNCTESKPNYSLTVPQDEMLKVDTAPKSECLNTIYDCGLQPARNDPGPRKLNAKRSRTTRRSRNKIYFDNKRQYKKDTFPHEYQILDVETSAQGGDMVRKRNPERGSFPSAVSCRHCCQTLTESSFPVDKRWASALGSNEHSVTDVNKIEYQRKRNFPIRIRTGSKQTENDAYIPARTRRLTVESPAENLLVHTSYDRPNPKMIDNAVNIELANRRNILYIGVEADHINTDGTRRLVCETECLSSKDPKTKHLVIENNASIFSHGKINSMSEETKQRWQESISGSIACSESISESRNELPGIGTNSSDKSVKWYGASCARMIGNFVVIGTSKSIRSVMNMVQNQMKNSVTSGASSEAVNLPEAGDVGGKAPRKAAIGESARGGASGDHLTGAVSDGDYSNCTNNNVYMQDTAIDCKHQQRLDSSANKSVSSEDHENMAICTYRTSIYTNTMVFCMKRTRYSTHTMVFCQTWGCCFTVISCTQKMSCYAYTVISCMRITAYCLYTVISCMKITPYFTYTVISCMKITPSCTYTVTSCRKIRPWCTHNVISCMQITLCCTYTLISCRKITPCCFQIRPPITNTAPCRTIKLNNNLTIGLRKTSFVRNRSEDNTFKIMIAVTYQLVNKTTRIAFGRPCSLSVTSTEAKPSCEPNRNNSSARENNDCWEEYKMDNQAGTETTDLSQTTFAQECEMTLSCPSCSLIQQMKYQDGFLPFRDFTIQVEATDINPDEETQTCESSFTSIERRPTVRYSIARRSLVEELNESFLNRQVTFTGSPRNCNSCCEISVWSDESDFHEIETQVKATYINPSNSTQTGESLTKMDLFPTTEETRKEIKAKKSKSTICLLSYVAEEIKSAHGSESHIQETSSLPEFSETEYYIIDTRLSLPPASLIFDKQNKQDRFPTHSIFDTENEQDSYPTPSIFDTENQQDSYPKNEFRPQTKEFPQENFPQVNFPQENFAQENSPQENPVALYTPEERNAIEILESGLVWEDHGFMVQREPSDTRCGSVVSLYGRQKSELEILKPDVEVFHYREHDFQSTGNRTNYMQNSVDHESGGYSIGSIPTSRMALTLLDPAPVYDFTFTKDQWQPKYRHRIFTRNASLDRNIEEDEGQDPEEAQATGSNVDATLPTVHRKRQRSDDPIENSPPKKDPAQGPYIMY